MKVIWILVFAVVSMLGVVEGMNVNFKAENGSEDSHTLQKRSPQSGVGSKKREKVWLNHTELNRRIAAKIKQRYAHEKDMLKKKKVQTKKQKKEEECRTKVTFHCGCNALKAFEKQLKTKCEIREEFFNCTTVVKDACPRHWKKFPWPPKDNMTQIARAIWATRGCLWGSDNEIVNFKELNVDAQVCSKTFDSPKSNKRPKGPKGPKSTKGKRVLKGKKPRQNKKKT